MIVGAHRLLGSKLLVVSAEEEREVQSSLPWRIRYNRLNEKAEKKEEEASIGSLIYSYLGVVVYLWGCLGLGSWEWVLEVKRDVQGSVSASSIRSLD